MSISKRTTFSIILLFNLASILAALGILLSAFKHMPTITNFISGLYLFLTLVGYTGLIWFIISTASFISYKICRTLVAPATITSFSLLLLYLDVKVYSLYRAHLSVGLLEYVIKEALSELSRISYADTAPLLLGFLLLIFLVYKGLKLITEKAQNLPLKRITTIFYSGFFIFFLISQLTYMYADVINYIPIKKWSRHIPVYHPLTAKRALINSGIVDSSKIRKFEMRSNFKDSTINYPKELSCVTNSTVKPNILWLFIDAWRFNDFNAETTPNIYSWVAKNKIDTFKNHWSVGGATIPSLFSMFYGVPPLYIKSFTESGITPIFISKLLKENYELQISTGWPIDNTTLSKNVFKEVPDLRVSIGDKEAWESDAFMKEEILSFLKNRDENRPYFSFMIFDSVHDYSLPPTYKPLFVPYSKNLNYLSLGPNTDPTEYHNKYKNSAHYVDSIIGDILDSPRIKDSRRPTVIVVSSDHGEQFNDLKKNYWGHNSNFSRFQLKVPLFILWDNLNKKDTKIEFEHMTSHNDMSHTFLEDVFKCKPSKQQSVGHNLYSTIERTPLLLSTYSKHAMLTEDRIYSYEPGLGYEVYDYDYNEVLNSEVPNEIFKQYLNTSTQFYN